MAATSKYTKVEGKYVWDREAMLQLMLEDAAKDPDFVQPDMGEAEDSIWIGFYDESGTGHGANQNAYLELRTVDVEGDGTTPV